TENGMRLSEARVVTAAGTSGDRVDRTDGGVGGRLRGDAAAEQQRIDRVLAALAAAEARPNASIRAIGDALPDDPGWRPTAVAPFSSATKWSGVSFADEGHWLIGAPDVLLDPSTAVAREAERIGARGLRVLLLAEGARPVDAPDATADARPAALVVLEQKVRPDARPTLDYFEHQGVAV